MRIFGTSHLRGGSDARLSRRSGEGKHKLLLRRLCIVTREGGVGMEVGVRMGMGVRGRGRLERRLAWEGGLRLEGRLRVGEGGLEYCWLGWLSGRRVWGHGKG